MKPAVEILALKTNLGDAYSAGVSKTLYTPRTAEKYLKPVVRALWATVYRKV